MEHRWPLCMTLPCRMCSSTRGELPVTAFTTATSYPEIWRTCIGKGQGLICFRCNRQLGNTIGHIAAVVYCDGCHSMKTKREFTASMRQKWERFDHTEEIMCKTCEGDASSRTLDWDTKYTCCGTACSSDTMQKEWPEHYFLKRDLVHTLVKESSARCARCQVIDDPSILDVFECNACHTTKHLSAYSAVFCKQFLLKERRAQTYRCMDCQFPKCAQCDAQPEKPVSPNHLDAKGKWYCRTHRYPPCSVCRITPRPPGWFDANLKFKQWVCATCQTNPPAIPTVTDGSRNVAMKSGSPIPPDDSSNVTTKAGTIVKEGKPQVCDICKEQVQGTPPQLLQTSLLIIFCQPPACVNTHTWKAQHERLETLL